MSHAYTANDQHPLLQYYCQWLFGQYNRSIYPLWLEDKERGGGGSNKSTYLYFKLATVQVPTVHWRATDWKTCVYDNHKRRSAAVPLVQREFALGDFLQVK